MAKRFPYRVTVADLPERKPGQTGPALHCFKCGNRYSGDPADYWSRLDDRPFRCGCPGRPLMALGSMRETFVPAIPERGPRAR